MHLHAIYTGKPTSVEFKNKTVETGIYKNLRKGSVKVNFLNLEGDQQADLKVHGGVNKAVYAYPQEHYTYWSEHAPELKLAPGAVGENLLVSGFDEAALQVSDVLEIGSAGFMVTVPRMPCFKLGIKVGDPGFVKAFLESRKTGFYLKVLQEGTIKAGDSIKLTKGTPDAVTVDEVTRLYSTDKENIVLLKKAIATEALPEDWRSFFGERLTKLD